VQREVDRVKQLFLSQIDDLGQSMVDCLKRRDRQLEQQFKTIRPLISTPMHSSASTTPKESQSLSKSDPVTQNRSKQVTYFSSSTIPPVKIELPTFSNLDAEDPIEFIDRFEEYKELRPLYAEELLASLSVSLKGTAKSWWRAEKHKIKKLVFFQRKVPFFLFK